MTPKSIFKSKAFWIAIAQAALGVVVFLAAEYPEVGGLLILKSALDIVIRALTVEPIKV